MIPTEIVYFAVNRWDSMVQREQHLMMGLSRTYRILFVDPPLSFLTILLGKIQGKRWRFRSSLERVDEQLVIYTPPAFPPFSQYFEWVNAFHTSLLISLTKRVLEKLSFKNFIVGIGRPFLANVVKELKPRLSYYDCSDDYLVYPGLKADKEMLRRSEEKLFKWVDLLFCSSVGLKEAKTPFHRNCFVIPNGVDLTSFDRISSEIELSPDMKRIKKPILGYVGTIGEWFDFDALIELAHKRPDWSFVLIGPLTSNRFSSIFKGVPNIYWLGEKEYRELPNYLRMFDVCLIPFKVNEFTKKIYPTKFHQYLGVGKPVVSSRLPDLESFSSWVDFYSDVKEMENKIEGSLKEDSKEKALERRKVASENSWARRVESMIQIFNTFLKERKPSP